MTGPIDPRSGWLADFVGEVEVPAVLRDVSGPGSGAILHAMICARKARYRLGRGRRGRRDAQRKYGYDLYGHDISRSVDSIDNTDCLRNRRKQVIDLYQRNLSGVHFAYQFIFRVSLFFNSAANNFVINNLQTHQSNRQ